VGVALALRVLLILTVPSDRPPEPYEYEEIVTNILEGRGLASKKQMTSVNVLPIRARSL